MGRAGAEPPGPSICLLCKPLLLILVRREGSCNACADALERELSEDNLICRRIAYHESALSTKKSLEYSSLNNLRTLGPFSLQHLKPYGQKIEASAVGVGVAYAVETESVHSLALKVASVPGDGDREKETGFSGVCCCCWIGDSLCWVCWSSCGCCIPIADDGAAALHFAIVLHVALTERLIKRGKNLLAVFPHCSNQNCARVSHICAVNLPETRYR